MKDELLGKNKKLRQAISSAIDRDKFIELFLNGRGTKMVSALPEGIPDRPEKPVLKYDLDLKKAKKLLGDAGFPEGTGLPILKLDMRDTSTLSRQMGEFFIQELAKINVKLQVQYNTYPAYVEKTKQSNFQIAYGTWILDYPDGENVFQLLYGPNQSPGANTSSFKHSKFDELYDAISRTISSQKRRARVTEMDAILKEEVPWVFLINRIAYRLHQPWLKNYRQAEMILNKFKYFRIDIEEKKKQIFK